MTVAVVSRRGSDFAQLSQRIRQAGLLDRRYGYYAVRIGLVMALYAGGWVAFALIGNSWWQIVTGGFMAVAFAQLALVSHDLAHRQVFRGLRATELAGLVAGNIGIGMSYGWWMNKHTRHHANPNHEDEDPDVAPDILVWSQRQANNARGVARFVGRWQAFLFFPLLTLEGFNLHVSSLRALRRPGFKRRWTELTLLVTHLVVYTGGVFLVLSPGKAVAFIAVHQALFGLYLGCTFAPNHKGMPMVTGDEKFDFLRRQVLTSRNIGGGVWLDVLYGGLNHQIEHHLFPSMPTPNLRRARTIVRQYCAELDIPYVSAGVRESYREALRHLHDSGATLRA